MKFLLDTSFLISALRFKVDILSELMKFGKPELYTLRSVVSELAKISSSSGKSGKNALLALSFVNKKVKIIEDVNRTNTDESIINIAKDKEFIVCTQDSELKKKLKRIGVSIITIRQKKYLSKE